MDADHASPAAAVPHRLVGGVIALWHELPEDFEEQLAAVGHRAEAYHVDDGRDDALRAADGFEAMGLRGVFFITTGWICTPGFVTEETIRQLVRRGHEIGNHSHTHRSASDLPADQVRADIAMAQSILSDVTGYAPRRFAWPHGRHNPITDAVADEFGFVEVRDISRVVRRIATKTPADLRELFR